MHWLAQYAERIAHTPAPYFLGAVIAVVVAILATVPEALRAAHGRPARILRAE